MSRLLVVVGSGGVGKTTIAAALGCLAARRGERALVMTFDPSHRLKDALGLDAAATERPTRVPLDAAGSLEASLLDARATFDRLVARYAPDEAARQRILANRYYRHLAGSLGGILEYMAVERLFEVWREGRYDRVILDTPPTREALDFLEAPRRIVGFLDSGAVRLGTTAWFDERGRLRPARRLGPLGKPLERFLDEIVGLDLLRDASEFFRAFGPLYEGFRGRAAEVEELLGSAETLFVLAAGPGEEKIPDTLFFARRLEEEGYRLGPVVVNRIHPRHPAAEERRPDPGDGRALLAWLGRRDSRGLAALGELLGGSHPLVELPLLAEAPTERRALLDFAELLGGRWSPPAAA